MWVCVRERWGVGCVGVWGVCVWGVVCPFSSDLEVVKIDSL